MFLFYEFHFLRVAYSIGGVLKRNFSYNFGIGTLLHWPHRKQKCSSLQTKDGSV